MSREPPFPRMRVLVTGGRNYANRAAVFDALCCLQRQKKALVIIQGGATGADELAREWAWAHCVPMITEPYDRALGRAGGPVRNQRMLDEWRPDLVIAFPGGAGTQDMVRRARAAGVRIEFPMGEPDGRLLGS